MYRLTRYMRYITAASILFKVLFCIVMLHCSNALFRSIPVKTSLCTWQYNLKAFEYVTLLCNLDLAVSVKEIIRSVKLRSRNKEWKNKWWAHTGLLLFSSLCSECSLLSTVWDHHREPPETHLTALPAPNSRVFSFWKKLDETTQTRKPNRQEMLYSRGAFTWRRSNGWWNVD